jgi:hypothetical protein
MAQACLITGIAQIIVFGLYFVKEGFPGYIEPASDLELKFICVLMLHFIIRPDLKSAIELLEYL